MHKTIHILFFILLGLLWIPTEKTYACDKAEDVKTIQCCKSEQQNKSKGCCDKDACLKHDISCQGECENTSCHCATPSSFAFVLPDFIESLPNLLLVDDLKCAIIYVFYSSDFFSIWTPPKIA